jgi:hypothetical protein
MSQNEMGTMLMVMKRKLLLHSTLSSFILAFSMNFEHQAKMKPNLPFASASNTKIN